MAVLLYLEVRPELSHDGCLFLQVGYLIEWNHVALVTLISPRYMVLYELG